MFNLLLLFYSSMQASYRVLMLASCFPLWDTISLLIRSLKPVYTPAAPQGARFSRRSLKIKQLAASNWQLAGKTVLSI
jgi:hypothetical protein